MKRHKKPLADLMRSSRTTKGYSIDYMADKCELAKSTLWELENKRQLKPRMSTLQAVCKAYGFAISRVAGF